MKVLIIMKYVHINFNFALNNNIFYKKYVKKKEREQHLPGN